LGTKEITGGTDGTGKINKKRRKKMIDIVFILKSGARFLLEKMEITDYMNFSNDLTTISKVTSYSSKKAKVLKSEVAVIAYQERY